MSIQVNPGTNAINWEMLLSQIGDVEKTQGADGKDVFTITSKVDGEMRTITVNIPDDLEIPEAVDAGTLSSLVSKLETSGLGFTPEQISKMKDAVANLYTQSAGALNDVQAKSVKGGVLYDIYLLMALMIDVAQSQRDAAREMRTAQNLAIQKAIQDQADQQREAAKVGMIVGIVCGACSALVSIGLMAGQSFAASSQSKIMAQSGADAAKMQTKMLQNTDTKAHAATQLQTTESKVGNEVATKVKNEFAAQLTDDQAGDLKTNLDTAIAAHDAAKMEFNHKEANLEAAQEVLGARRGAQSIAEQSYNEKTTALNNAQAKLDAAKKLEAGKNSLFGLNQGSQDLAAAQSEFDQAKAAQTEAKAQFEKATKAYDDQNTVVANAQRDLQIANEKVTTTKTKVAEARNDYQKTVNDVAAVYKEKYQKAVDDLANPPAGSNKTELEANVTKARTEMEMAFAMQADLLAQDGVMTPSQQKDLVAGTRIEANNAMDRVYQRMDFKSAERRLSALQGMNNINQSIGGVLQNLAQNLSAMGQAEAQRQGAVKQEQELMLDQTNDLFQQEQKLIDQVIQLCQAIIQAENQSMRDAIQA